MVSVDVPRERESERDPDIKIIKHIKTILEKNTGIEERDLWQAKARKEPI